MQTEKKEKVRNISIGIFLIALIVLGLFIIVNKENKIKDLDTKYSDLNTMYQKRDSMVNDFTEAFDSIEKNLTFVKNKRKQLSIERKEGNPSHNEEVVADIKLMNTMLEESSKKIDELEKKLKASGIDIKSFKNKIAKLTKSVEEQNESIALLQSQLKDRDNQIAMMSEKVGNLQSDIAVKDSTLEVRNDSLQMKSKMIAQKDDDLNRAYIASGTYKELKDNGVVKKDGGFLFLGKNEEVKDNVNENYFTKLDKRSTDVFPIFSKKAEMISHHPDSSYRYIYENDKIAYLKIENPDEFWKYTKYAVVQVK